MLAVVIVVLAVVIVMRLPLPFFWFKPDCEAWVWLRFLCGRVV